MSDKTYAIKSLEVALNKALYKASKATDDINRSLHKENAEGCYQVLNVIDPERFGNTN